MIMLLIPALLGFVGALPLQRTAFPVLQPETYSSASGVYELHVDPTDRHGIGAGNYRLTKDDEVVWAGSHPFTLWEVVVADDGRVAGYAYTRGITRKGQLVVALFSPGGDLLVEDRVRQRGSRYPHGSPSPMAKGLYLNEVADRFVVPIWDAGGEPPREEWWSYRLSDGSTEGRIVPGVPLAEGSKRFWTCSTKPIDSTPLMLVHAYVDRGDLFLVLDRDWKPVWKRLEPRRLYELDEEIEKQLGEGAALTTGAPEQFGLWLVKQDVHKTFQVREHAEDDRRWAVSEIGSEPHASRMDDATDKRTAAKLPTIELVPIGETRLVAEEPPESPIRDVLTFGFPGPNRIEFVRGEDKREVFSCVLLDESGELIRETRFELPVPEGVGIARWSLLVDGRWLVLHTDYNENGSTRAWIADPRTGSIEALDGFQGPFVSVMGSACPTNDGGFVVLGSSRGGGDERIACYSRKGEHLWSIGSRYEDPTKLFSPRGVAVTANDLVVVLQGTQDKLQIYSMLGEHVESVSLDALSLNYPSGIVSDGNGVLVHDFNGNPPTLRMNLGGKVSAGLRPHFADGRSSPALPRASRVDPHGSVWTTDKHSLLRLAQDGQVDIVLGEAPDDDTLSDACTVFIDSLGRVSVQDQRTGAVHVFGTDGLREYVCRPLPTDFEQVDSIGRLAVERDGTLHVTGRMRKGHVVFDPSGARIGTSLLGSREMAFSPLEDHAWVQHYDHVTQVRTDGELLTEIRRAPDGTWLRHPQDIAVTPKGELVILDQGDHQSGKSARLAIYSPSGEPLRTLNLPFGSPTARVACSERWVVVYAFDERAVLVDLEDGRALQTEIPDDRGSSRLGFSPDGTELWFVQASRMLLRRFRITDG
jgi:hypothetical protein